jgi:hypothetical protein
MAPLRRRLDTLSRSDSGSDEDEDHRVHVRLVCDLSGAVHVNVPDLTEFRRSDAKQAKALANTNLAGSAVKPPRMLFAGFSTSREMHAADKWLPLHVAILFLGKCTDLTQVEWIDASGLMLSGGAFDGDGSDNCLSWSNSDDDSPEAADEVEAPNTSRARGVRGAGIGSAQAEASIVHKRGASRRIGFRREHVPTSSVGALMASQQDEETQPAGAFDFPPGAQPGREHSLSQFFSRSLYSLSVAAISSLLSFRLLTRRPPTALGYSC